MPMVLRFDRGTLLLDHLSAAESEVLAQQPPWGFLMDPRVGKYRAPASLYRPAVAALRERGLPLVDRAPAYHHLNLTLTVVPSNPYPHQREAIAAWEEGGRRGVVVLPTGAGKTYVAEAAIASTGRSTLVVVPTIDLDDTMV